MTIIDFICNFPEIKEKDDKYYLFLGIVSGLTNQEVSNILDYCITQNIFKRRILVKKISVSAQTWKMSDNDVLFEKVYSLIESLDSYFKKESASLMLIGLCPYITKTNQNKLLRYFLYSSYINNRKRAYEFLQTNWSSEYQKNIEETWQTYGDEEIINLLVSKMPKKFLLKNFKNILDHFKEEYLECDFYLRILRNRFYVRIAKSIPSEINKLKEKEPISYISIIKECGRKIDLSWAMEIYKKNPRSRKYLPRWYADMDLWKDILKNKRLSRFL